MAFARINFYFRHTHGGQFLRFREDEHLFAVRGVLINLQRRAEELGLTDTVRELSPYLDEVSDKLMHDFGWDPEDFEVPIDAELFKHYNTRVARVWPPTAMAIGAIAYAQRMQSSIQGAEATCG